MNCRTSIVKSEPSLHLAQFNYADARHELDHPSMRGFADELLRINALADGTPGFIWRLKNHEGHSVDFRPWPEKPLRMITLSVWRDLASFYTFAYTGEHAEMLRCRHQWFVRPSEPSLVLWWVPEGTKPSIETGIEKLRRLVERGPTPDAFDLKLTYSPSGSFLGAASSQSANLGKGTIP